MKMLHRQQMASRHDVTNTVTQYYVKNHVINIVLYFLSVSLRIIRIYCKHFSLLHIVVNVTLLNYHAPEGF